MQLVKKLFWVVWKVFCCSRGWNGVGDLTMWSWQFGGVTWQWSDKDVDKFFFNNKVMQTNFCLELSNGGFIQPDDLQTLKLFDQN